MKNITNNTITITTVCEECKESFNINSLNNLLVYNKEYKVNGQSIYLTYYDCPKCNKRHFVQIDDKFTLQELKEVQRLFVSLSMCKSNGKTIPKNKSTRFKRIQQHLADNRNQLMKDYTDKAIYDDVLGKVFILYFSVLNKPS